MQVALTEEQVRNVLTLLNRVNVAGSEALGLVVLQQIFTQALAPPQPPADPTPEEGG